MMLMKFLVAFFLITQVAVFVQSQTILDVAQNLKLTTFRSLADAAGITSQLTSSGSVTIFAPTDQAFAKFPPQLLATISKPTYLWALRELLLYHVVPGKYLSKDLRDGTLVTESRLKTLQVTNSSSTYLPLVNDAQTISVDNQAGGSVIHVINSLLVPLDLQPQDLVTTLSTYGFFNTPVNTFLSALSASGLGASLVQKIDRTLFVPTDAAFAKLPRGVLSNLLRPQNIQQLTNLLNYHVLPGRVYVGSNTNPASLTNAISRKLTFFPPNVLSTTDVNGVSFANTTVLDGDIFAVNGVVNIVNDVLVPPELLPVDLPSTIPTVPVLSTFWAAVKATGNLVNVFQNAKNVTIFAPSDAAFQKLPPGMLQGFLNNLTTLRTLLNAHVVRPALLVSDLAGSFPSNVAGFSLSFSRLPTGRLLLNGNVGINTVNVNGLSVNDIIATNGVIHVIDTVLFPSDLVPKDTLSSLPQANFSTFLAAVAATKNWGPILTSRLFPHTIFAPTNQAFAQLPKGYVQDLLKPANIDKLRAVILYHITRGVNFLPSIVNQTFVSVNNREKFYVLRNANDFYWLNPFFDASNQPELTFNYAGVVPSLSNMPATNGVVHAINKVILPPSASPLDLWGTINSHPLLKEFASVLLEKNYTSVLAARGRELYTLFVPRDGTINSTNTAIRQSVLANVDSYAISGAYLSSDLPKTGTFFAPSLAQRSLNITVDANQRYAVNGVTILQTDIIAKNGIIHILDGVLSFV